MTRHRVAVTGLGLVPPFGGGPEQFFSSLLQGQSAIRFFQADNAPTALAVPALQCLEFQPETVLGKSLAHTMDRFSQLGTAAALAAWHDAGFPLKPASTPRRGGVSWGTGVGGALTFERGYRDFYLAQQKTSSPLAVVLAMNNAAAAHIAIQLELGGPCLTYSVACASSTVAIGEAYRRIREGQTPFMLAGGSEAPLAHGVVSAWQAMRILAPGDAQTAFRACRPFSRDRAGLVLGEGAGALVLEEWEHAVARGARIYAELSGYGTTCDHAHLVRPHPAGEIRAIQQALEDGDLAREDIGYVNAHATATPEGDAAEVAALKAVFGRQAATLPVSSTKSMHGHLLGAAGAIEAIVTVLSVYRKAVPPTAHLETVDPTCEGVQHVIGDPMTGIPLRAALSNSFAFGGVNAVLAFRDAS